METLGCTGFKGPGARITAAFPIDRLQDRYCSQSQAHNLSAAPVVFDCVALPVPDPIPFSLVPIPFTLGHSNSILFYQVSWGPNRSEPFRCPAPSPSFN